MSHVLFISHARGLHGAEAVMVQAAKACAARGARVTVVVPSIVPEAGLEKALEGIHGVQILALPYRPAGGHLLRTMVVQWYNRRTVRELVRFVRLQGVDVIYSSSSITILGCVIARETGVKHVWHFHEPVDARFGWDISLIKTYQDLLRYADTVVFISQKQLEEWETTLEQKIPGAKIIYNPIKPIRVQESAPHAGVRVGFIGRFEERKNIGTLVRVFEKLHREHLNTSLWLCGALNDTDKAYIEQMTDMRAPVLQVLPQTNDVSSFYNSIDILVLPSWRETMPLVVLEAMQAGVCVVQTSQSGMNELLAHDQDTLFFPPDNEELLLYYLNCCMNEQERRRLAEEGKRKALLLVNEQCFDRQIQDLLCK